MNGSLNCFLWGSAGQATATEPPAVALATAEALAPEPTAASEPEPAVATSDDDDDATPTSDNRTMPVHVLRVERDERKGYKAQVIRQK